jgi:hypothetical protein
MCGAAKINDKIKRKRDIYRRLSKRVDCLNFFAQYVVELHTKAC